MVPQSDGTHLSSLIDELWHRPHERASLATQIVVDLNDIDWLILAAWDVAATLGPPSGKLSMTYSREMQIMDSWGKLFLIASLMESEEKPVPQFLIGYQASDVYVILDEASPNLPVAQFVHDPKSLLLAVQLIRDHIDSALLRPPDLRNAQIAQFAADSGIEEDYFRRLASWFSAIEIYLRK